MWTLQQKAWVLLIGMVGALTGAAVWFSSQNTAALFTALEQQRAEQDGDRARRLFQLQLTQLSASGKDYAYWIDLVKFIAGKNPTHLEDNFTPEAMAPLGFSGAFFFDARGRLVARASDLEGGAAAPNEPELLRFAQTLVPAVVGDSRSETVIDTYHQIDQTLYLFSVAPVRELSAVGTQPKGAQVVYRRFGLLETERFAQMLLSSVVVSFEPPPAGAADQRLVVLDDRRAEVRVVIRDHQNNAVAELVVSLDRQLHQQGQALVWASALQVALAGLVLGAFLVILLDRMLLQRLTRLHIDLERVTDQGPEAGRDIRVPAQKS